MASLSGQAISTLISAPLLATADAQKALACTTSRFLEGIQKEANVDFKIVNPVSKKEASLSVPKIALVNVPSLSVKNVDITFNLSVSSSSTDSISSDYSGESSSSASGYYSRYNYYGSGHYSSGSSGYASANRNYNCAVASSSKTERKTDCTGKYSVSISARDDGPNEGLAKIISLMNAQIPSTLHMDNSASTTTTTDSDVADE
eukprot:TRINITY_DN7374_c0_g1_i1.p1 TRINITY_DN7374_c0_g1~~TRINITY_DN7374_c0_g1_i1.p1  ORF type:complete len:213 (+),score=56.49 TRINITY_DN7374_c0_g1_i1:28-639(+)